MVKKTNRVGKVLKKVSLVIVLLLTVTYVSLRIVYPNYLKWSHNIEAPGIDVLEYVEIGGIKQAIIIRGENIENPVILYLHGGPGSPMIPLFQAFQYKWESDYTVVQWDQRNCGLTYRINDPDQVKETMDFDTVLQDAHEVTQYIKQKLNKEKIIVLGHSWGTVLGTALIQTYPEDYLAYLGVGQVKNMRENERVGYEMALQYARDNGLQKDVAELESIAPYPSTKLDEIKEKLLVLRKYQSKYKMAVDYSPIMLFSVVTSPYYSLEDLINFARIDTFQTQGALLRFMFEDHDTENYGLKYEVPVYYIMGENDGNTPFSLAKELFQLIEAPDKRFFSIADAGHAPMIENQAEFNRILLEELLPLFK